MTREAEILIVGGGIAGASLAAEISGEASVLMIEAEDQPGYHSTGRSAAFWSEIYGGRLIQPLTSASGPFLANPPPDFHERPFLTPRGALHIARVADAGVIENVVEAFRGAGVPLEPLDRIAIEKLIPGLRTGWDRGLYEPSCADIDVGALHGAYLRQARARGARLVTSARLERARRNGARWLVETSAGTMKANILVNAAGAWADDVARRSGQAPLSIRPYRRTIAQIRTDPPPPRELPLVLDALGRFYFKPEGGRLWLSPHDESACNPCDAAPEETDIALAIHELEQIVDWQVERVEHKWAGLRSFAPDRLPVYGFTGDATNFFWFAGQGGFGIQTAPAAAKLAASLLLKSAPDPMVAGIDPVPYLATRFTN